MRCYAVEDYFKREAGEILTEVYPNFPILRERAVYKRDCKIQDKKQRDLNSIQTYSNVSPNIYSVPDDEEVTPERPVATAIINTNINPSNIAQYINTEFHSKKESLRNGNQNTQHPHVWSKDKNGKFTYNGSLASDC